MNTDKDPIRTSVRVAVVLAVACLLLAEPAYALSSGAAKAGFGATFLVGAIVAAWLKRKWFKSGAPLYALALVVAFEIGFGLYWMQSLFWAKYDGTLIAACYAITAVAPNWFLFSKSAPIPVRSAWMKRLLVAWLMGCLFPFASLIACIPVYGSTYMMLESLID